MTELEEINVRLTVLQLAMKVATPDVDVVAMAERMLAFVLGETKH